MLLWICLILVGVGAIVWGAETFAEHLGKVAVGWGISAFALALLLAGAEPEELATAVTAALKQAPAIALGDVVGANIAICLVAVGVGAWLAPMPFSQRVLRYGWGGLAVGIVATAIVWDGVVERVEGAILVSLYVIYVIVIWWQEKQPPALGELEELAKAEAQAEVLSKQSVIMDFCLVLAGVGGMVIGSILLVEAVLQITQVEATQTKLALSLVGFATAFELVVLAWSAAKRGITDATVAGVVGSFAYNVTMTLGTAAIMRPLQIVDGSLLHLPLLFMLGSLALVVVLAQWCKSLDRGQAWVLLVSYPIFIGLMWAIG
ncbi:MAG: sodium:calcium antiporter [Pseudanabaenaceae cyanobacterium]